MPNIDENAKNFELTRASWFGNAVSLRRNALGLTASELSRRTAELGYPISRGAVAKIESNLRSGKVDVTEVLVLAAALDIPPVLLLFPQLSTDGGAVVLPGVLAKEDDAVRWVLGQVSFPQEFQSSRNELEGRPNPPNDGVNLMAAMTALEEAVETRISLVHHLHEAQEDPAETRNAQHMLERNSEQIEAIRKEIRDTRAALWGTRSSNDDAEAAPDD